MEQETVTVLLVEDNQIDVEAVVRAFGERKIANPMVVAKDGREALEILRTPGKVPRPFLTLLDLNMPRMNGIEFLAELREDSLLRDSVVFVLTTSKSDEDRAAAYDANIAGYIVKSDVGRGFLKLVELLDKYWHVVVLPGAR